MPNGPAKLREETPRGEKSRSHIGEEITLADASDWHKPELSGLALPHNWGQQERGPALRTASRERM